MIAIKKILNNPKEYSTIRWVGTDTRNIYAWVAYGTTYKEIWDATVNGGVNNYDDFVAYVLDKIGKTQDDYYDEDGEYLEDKWNEEVEWYAPTEEEYRDMIESSRGNAYYSKFQHWNDETLEWEDEE